MSLEPLIVGSIKDLVVCSVWALGDLATKVRLHKAVDSNDAVISIAIDTLVRDGYMRPHEAGHYVLADELAATLKPTDRKALGHIDDILTVANPAAPTASGDDMVQTKRCTGKCGLEKDSVKDFYSKSSVCKRCTLDRQKDLKAQRSNSAAPAPAPVPRATRRRPQDASHALEEQLVIPASGQITCKYSTVEPFVFTLQQHKDQIVGSIEQLQALRDWASGVIKKASAT